MIRKSPRAFTLFLLAACLATGFGWRQFSATHDKIQRERKLISTRNRAIEAKIESLQAATTEERLRAVPDGQLTPDEKRLQRVKQCVQQLLEERLHHPATSALPPPPEGPGGDLFPELMGDPEYARLAMVIHRYGGQRANRTLRLANIPIELQKKVYELMIERDLSMTDAEQAARKLGFDEAAIWQIRHDTWDKVSAEITALLGGKPAESISLEGSNEANELTKSLETRLSYSPTPLTEEQAQLVFAAAHEAGIHFMLEPGQGERVIERAKPSLNTEQLAALRQVVAEYNDGKKMWVTPAP